MLRSSRVPSYRLHKARGLAVVTIDGHNHYLGPFGSPESHSRYAAMIAEWQRGAAARPVAIPAGPSFTVGELALKYLAFAESYYVKNEVPTAQIHQERGGLRALVALYETEQAADFGPLKLKNIQQHLIGKSLSRATINKYVDAIRRTFKWGTSEQLVPASIFNALQTVAGLKKGRSGARETAPIRPVDEGTVSATLPHLSATVAAMVQLQLATGARPGEICIVRPCDVTMQARGAWVFRPEAHKTEHHEPRTTNFYRAGRAGGAACVPRSRPRELLLLSVRSSRPTTRPLLEAPAWAAIYECQLPASCRKSLPPSWRTCLGTESTEAFRSHDDS